MSRTKLIAAVAAASFSLVTSWVQASLIVVQDSVDDYEAQKRSSGTPLYAASENFGVSRVGHQSNFNNSGTTAPGGITSVFFFQLPALTPGEAITAASFGV